MYSTVEKVFKKDNCVQIYATILKILKKRIFSQKENFMKLGSTNYKQNCITMHLILFTNNNLKTYFENIA